MVSSRGDYFETYPFMFESPIYYIPGTVRAPKQAKAVNMSWKAL